MAMELRQTGSGRKGGLVERSRKGWDAGGQVGGGPGMVRVDLDCDRNEAGL